MDKELQRLINSVIEKAADDSEASDKLVDALYDYFCDTTKENYQHLGDVLNALKSAAEKGNGLAGLYFTHLVSLFEDLPVEQKELAVKLGAQCGFFEGGYYSALVLMDDAFRPNDFFYNWRGGLFGSHMLNEPDHAMREAARRFQIIVDHYEPNGDYPDWVLDSAVRAARLNLNKRGFGPGLPLGDEKQALSDLDFVMANGKGRQYARAAATKGAYLLMKNHEDEAAEFFIEAIENYPDSVIDFACEHMRNRTVYNRVVAACDAAKGKMSPNGLEAFKWGRSNWL